MYFLLCGLLVLLDFVFLKRERESKQNKQIKARKKMET